MQPRFEVIEDRFGVFLAKIDALDGPAVTGEVAVEGPLDAFVRQEASEMGVAVDDIRSIGTDGVAFSFGQITAPALFGWIASLERRGLVVSEIDVRPAAGSTLSARISLRQPQ